MTYHTFINLSKGLLVGDNVIPTDVNIQVALLGYAYDKVSNEADALRLFNIPVSDSVVSLRDGPGDYMVRKPILPIVTNNTIDLNYTIDLDEELCYPLARYFASFITKEKMAYHVAEAENLIRKYNSKVESHINKIKQGLINE